MRTRHSRYAEHCFRCAVGGVEIAPTLAVAMAGVSEILEGIGTDERRAELHISAAEVWGGVLRGALRVAVADD